MWIYYRINCRNISSHSHPIPPFQLANTEEVNKLPNIRRLWFSRNHRLLSYSRDRFISLWSFSAFVICADLTSRASFIKRFVPRVYSTNPFNPGSDGVGRLSINPALNATYRKASQGGGGLVFNWMWWTKQAALKRGLTGAMTHHAHNSRLNTGEK